MPVTRTLYLHMGHAKTGSSWIQTSLRMSQDALSAHGIRYAEGDRLAVDADHRITSGNGVGLLKSEESMSARLGRSDIAPDASTLFSQEGWGSDLDPIVASNLSRIAEQHGFGRVSVLLFIRDPMGHVILRIGSSAVKRAGAVARASKTSIVNTYSSKKSTTVNTHFPQMLHAPWRRWPNATVWKSGSATTRVARGVCWRRRPLGSDLPEDCPAAAEQLRVSTAR